jgi:hypothetical protein
LPSVALNADFNSVKDNDMSSAAANALTMPNRMRSWSRRSSEVAISEARAVLDARVEPSR